MTLNTKRSKAPPYKYDSYPESQISILLVLRTAIFELQAISRLVHRMTPNDRKDFELEGTPYTCYNYPESQISLRFAQRPPVLDCRRF